MQKEIKQSWLFDQTPQEIWEYLTRSELLQQWLMPTDFQPIVGHKFRFTCNKIIDCEVLEVNPFTKLSYSWQAHPVNGNQLFTSKVEWTLIPKDNGTELLLSHTGFTAPEDYDGHNKGWTTIGGQLTQLLNS